MTIPPKKKQPANGRRKPKKKEEAQEKPKKPYVKGHGHFEGKYVMRVICSCGHLYSFDADYEKDGHTIKRELWTCPECKRPTSVEELLPELFKEPAAQENPRKNTFLQPPPRYHNYAKKADIQTHIEQTGFTRDFDLSVTIDGHTVFNARLNGYDRIEAQRLGAQIFILVINDHLLE